MQIGSVTTPFGRRPMTLGLIKGQLASQDIKAGKTIDKWKVFRDACEARVHLGVTDRTLSVLNALLSFYPEKELSQGRGLIVFPSNNQLSLRAHGITGTTLRRHLAALVDAGLITRKDSPNGKRYAHKSRAGVVEDAYGFNLAPMLARADELAQLAQTVIDDRKSLRLAKERLSICRRDIRKLIATCITEGISGNFEATEARFVVLLNTIPRSPDRRTLEQLAASIEQLRDELVNQLETQLKSEETAAIATQTDRHIQNSDTESLIELEIATAANVAAEMSKEAVVTAAIEPPQSNAKIFPLGMVLKACPQIALYAPSGRILHWRDMISAAAVVSTMLGVSNSAYRQACESLGIENTAATIACILERQDRIKSAGGYLRDLTRRSNAGAFSIGPMLMALLRPDSPPSATTQLLPPKQPTDHGIHLSISINKARRFHRQIAN